MLGSLQFGAGEDDGVAILAPEDLVPGVYAERIAARIGAAVRTTLDSAELFGQKGAYSVQFAPMSDSGSVVD